LTKQNQAGFPSDGGDRRFGDGDVFDGHGLSKPKINGNRFLAIVGLEGGTINTSMGQADEPAGHPGAVFVGAGGEFEGDGDFAAVVAHEGGADAGNADGVIGFDGDDLIVADEGVEGIKGGFGNLDAAALGANGVGLRTGRQGNGSRSGDGGGRRRRNRPEGAAKTRKEKVNSHQRGDDDHDQSNLNQTLA